MAHIPVEEPRPRSKRVPRYYHVPWISPPEEHSYTSRPRNDGSPPDVEAKIFGNDMSHSLSS